MSMEDDYDCKNDSDVGRSLYAKKNYSVGDQVLADYPLTQWKVSCDDASCRIINFANVRSRLEQSSYRDDSDLLISTILAFNELQECLYSALDDFALPNLPSDITRVNEMVEIINDISQMVFQSKSQRFKQYLVKFMLICYTNAHQIVRDGVVNCALFPLASKMAHSCSPNTVFTINHLKQQDGQDSLRIQFTATREIKTADLLSCSYLSELDLLLPSVMRRERLLAIKYFVCQCQICKAESEQIVQAYHDDIVDSVYDAFRLCDDESDIIKWSSKAVPSAMECVRWLIVAHQYGSLVHALPVFENVQQAFYQKAILASLLFYYHLILQRREIHPVLVGKLLLLGFPLLKCIPLASMIDYQRYFYVSDGNGDDDLCDTRTFSSNSDFKVELVPQALCGDLKALKTIQWKEIEYLIALVLHQTGGWDCLKLFFKTRLCKQVDYQGDLLYLKSLKQRLN
ncbi:hypothetical protein MP228_008172 [Amoeboaphelidium protococcarum]|nr:hypothetical protein MP228_008172 [Amoeboaphelidium protococcarum]